MANQKQNEFYKAFLSGERSDVAIQKALIGVLVLFHKNNNSTITIKCEILDWLEKSPNPTGWRAKSIKQWLQDVAKFRITKDGNVKLSPGVEYKEEWLQVCKDVPWHHRLKPVKDWTDQTDSSFTMQAKGLIMGGTTFEKLAETYSANALRSIKAKADTAKLRDQCEDTCMALGKDSIDQVVLNKSFLEVLGMEGTANPVAATLN